MATEPGHPRRVAGRPQRPQGVHVAHGVGALPVAVVLVDHQLAVAGEVLERLALQDQVGAVGQAVEEGPVEDEEAAADARALARGLLGETSRRAARR